MYRTETEVRQNFDSYLAAARTEDVFITRNGKVISVLTSPEKAQLGSIASLRGILPSDVEINEKKIRQEHMRSRYEDK